MIRSLLICALLTAVVSCAAPTSLQVSAINYRGVSVLQDAVIAKHVHCASKGRDRCSEDALSELVSIDDVLLVANQYDDLRKSGFLDEAELSLASAKAKTRALRSLLDAHIPSDQRPLLDWSDE